MKRMKILMMVLAVLFYLGATSVYAQETRASTTQNESLDIEREDIGATATGGQISGKYENEGFSEEEEPTGIEKEDLGIAGAGEEETGNVETEFKVEKGERSSSDDGPGNVVFGDGIKERIPDSATGKKQRDIVVVGSKVKEVVREYGGEQTPERDFEAVLKQIVETEDDLEEYAVAVASTDSQIEEIKITYEEVKLKYSLPAKLFGLIDVDYTVTTSVDEQGRVDVKYPWWVAFTKNNAKDLRTKLEKGLSTQGEDAQLANIDLQNALQKQQQTLQIMSNVMKTKYDTEM